MGVASENKGCSSITFAYILVRSDSDDSCQFVGVYVFNDGHVACRLTRGKVLLWENINMFITNLFGLHGFNDYAVVCSMDHKAT